MASGPIISWQIDGETVETVTDFLFLALKSLRMVAAVTTLERIAPWKENYGKPRQRMKKRRRRFSDKGPSSQGYAFPVVMHGCESRTIKKAECRRIDAFELWCGEDS